MVSEAFVGVQLSPPLSTAVTSLSALVQVEIINPIKVEAELISSPIHISIYKGDSYDNDSGS